LSQYHADVGRAERRPSGSLRGHTTLATCVMVAVVALGGCSAAGAETASSCSGDRDSDGDGLHGCADPDCHRFELCRIHAALVPDAAVAGAGSAGRDGAAGEPPVGGTSGTGGTMAAVASGRDAEIDDAGTERDAAPMCSCNANEVCTSAGCIPIASATVYELRLLSADSPRGTFGPPPDGTCVEIACRDERLMGGAVVSYCPCEPELYVRVVHIAGDGDSIEEVVFTTAVQATSLSATFAEDAVVTITLVPGDALRFELWDDNVTTADNKIYECQPSLEELSPGPLECSVLSGTLGLDPFSIRATLSVE